MVLTIGLLVSLLGSSVADLVLPNRATLLPLVFAPLLAGIGLTVARALVVASVSAVLAVLLPEALFAVSGSLQYVRFAAVLGVCFAAVLTAYLRRRLEIVIEDVTDERRRVLEANDKVYQGLFAAKTWFDLGDREKGVEALQSALTSASGLIDDHLDKLGGPPRVGPPSDESDEDVIDLKSGEPSRHSEL